MRLLRLAAVAVALTFGAISQNAEAGPVTPFSITDNGLTITFLSAPDPSGFGVANGSPFFTLHGNVLIESAPDHNALGITFSQPVGALQLDFALDSHSFGHLDYQAFSGGFGGTMVSSGSASAVPPCLGCFIEGHLTVTPSVFDSVILTSPDTDAFAIDNVFLVTPDPLGFHFITFDTPEPLTLALFGAGLAGAGALRRRRKV